MDLSASTTPLLNEPTDVGPADVAHEDEQLLKKLAALWKSHNERDLEVRLKMGKLLNDRLGNPAVRLSYGQQVLKKAARQLHIAESDLSRMRWFAHHFGSVKDFQSEHPKVGSWTKVKELIAKLSAAGNGDGAASPKEEPSCGEKGAAVIGGILRSLGNTTERFRQNDFALDDAIRERLRKAIRQLLEVVGEPLQFRFEIEVLETPKSSTPVGVDPSLNDGLL